MTEEIEMQVVYHEGRALLCRAVGKESGRVYHTEHSAGHIGRLIISSFVRGWNESRAEPLS